MHVFAGTSGFSFDEWRGRFYPAGLPTDARLEYYASCLPSVEINNTFYQMPKRTQLEHWAGMVPDGFRFALKAPRRITHSQRLRPEAEVLEHFGQVALALGTRLGPILFQLPPFLRKDAPLLAEFLAKLPNGLQAAFEFRNKSWFDDEIFALLASNNAALCGGDSDEHGQAPPQIATADFGYLRLRAARYDGPSLRAWVQRIVAEKWSNAYVFLKHEVMGPDYARFVAAVAAGAPEPVLPGPGIRDVPLVQDVRAPRRKRRPEVLPQPTAGEANTARLRRPPTKRIAAR